MFMKRRKPFEAPTPLHDALNRVFEESFLRRLGLLIVVGLLIAGCGTSPTSSTTSGNPSAQPARSFAGLVDIGRGRKMYLNCRGSGSPTVVFVSGRSDRADIWSTLANPKQTGPAVLPGVATFTRVCAYDRPGTVTITGQHVEASRSSPVPQPTTAANGMTELHALLTAAKVPGPYVLVAHSWGGLIARLYAAHYPNEVSGLVLVDTLTELLFNGLTPQEQAWWITLNSNYSPELDPYHQETSNFVPSFQSLRTAPKLRRMPAVILASDQPYNLKLLAAQGLPLPPGIPVNFGPVIFKAHIAGQMMLAERLNAKLILDTRASHYVHTEQPQLVINSIRYVVDRVQNVPDPAGLSFTPQPNPTLDTMPTEDTIEG
ncbi:MAG: alpha/beta hydrolase [Chloroflexota bacterium]|nr:alpha/beta hydrolase [Chloroflexota bacterium]